MGGAWETDPSELSVRGKLSTSGVSASHLGISEDAPGAAEAVIALCRHSLSPCSHHNDLRNSPGLKVYVKLPSLNAHPG